MRSGIPVVRHICSTFCCRQTDSGDRSSIEGRFLLGAPQTRDSGGSLYSSRFGSIHLLKYEQTVNCRLTVRIWAFIDIRKNAIFLLPLDYLQFLLNFLFYIGILIMKRLFKCREITQDSRMFPNYENAEDKREFASCGHFEFSRFGSF